MNILENKSFLGKYASVVTYVLLAFQYLMIVLFPSSFSDKAEASYIYLWFYDVFLFMPTAIILFFPLKARRIIMSLVLIGGFIVFWTAFRFNTVFINTFVSLLFANKMLFFSIDDDQRGKILKWKTIRLFLAFAILPFFFVFESILESTGLVQHEKIEDAMVASMAGKLFMFTSYYLCLAYLEYRRIKKENKL
ncbi:hypothetical protein [Soonwooa sp.]|uniref:hypothetical protein n=1 Tax=Soonwooa sp. TaxID=1938592 RepID=UPI002636D4CD|nr:hypothetical protein [Soonwooa sp.]